MSRRLQKQIPLLGKIPIAMLTRCFGPLANARYTDMLCSPISMLHVMRHFL